MERAKLTERQIRFTLAGTGVAAFALLTLLEIATEQDEIGIFDVAVDGLSTLLTITATVGLTLLALRIQTQHQEKLDLIRDLDIAREEGERWHARLQTNLAGIRFQIEKQFRTWGMTEAEREVGLLILKGLSHKEIAALRGTVQATVRQQGQSIYQKSGLPGRKAFAAYFLEDLFSTESEHLPTGLHNPDGE